jgi:putative transposase
MQIQSESPKDYEKSAPALSKWLEYAIPEGLTVFAFPSAVRRRLRTSNGLERLNLELRRRFKVIGSFCNGASCVRLASAILMEVSEEWESGKVYLSPEPRQNATGSSQNVSQGDQN